LKKQFIGAAPGIKTSKPPLEALSENVQKPSHHSQERSDATARVHRCVAVYSGSAWCFLGVGVVSEFDDDEVLESPLLIFYSVICPHCDEDNDFADCEPRGVQICIKCDGKFKVT